MPSFRLSIGYLMSEPVPVCSRRGFTAAVCTSLLVTALALTAGCAGSSGSHAAKTPNRDALQPATDELAYAATQDWSNNVPAMMAAARNRLTTARSIVYQAAEQDRSLNEDEKQRVDSLVAGVKLDLRAAKARGSAVAVETRMSSLEQSRGSASQGGAGASDQNQRSMLKASKSKRQSAVQRKPTNQRGKSRQPRRRPPAMSSGPGVQHDDTQRPTQSGGMGR